MSPFYSSMEMDIPDNLLKFAKDEELERSDLKLKMGIEVHATIDSDWKAFSRTKANTNSLTSLGLLGVLPQINTGAIRAALKVSKMLNCDPPLEIGFERKSYFYFDLPRGYQLTQFLKPMGKNGYIFLPKLAKKINIFSVALEEDTAAYTQERGVYTLAPERLGVPLVEIATHPDFETIDELIECVKWIRLLLFYLKISKAEFEKGKLRIDLNISLVNKYDEAVTGRVEVKNLASYSAISGAAKAVRKMLVDQLESNSEEVMKNITCSWISDEERLEVTREKKSGADYFFVPESSIPLIKLDKKELQRITKNCDQNYLTELYDTINASSLPEREREEITHSYAFFWNCLTFYNAIKDWTNAFFILKMAKTEGWKEGSHPEVLTFLAELASSLRAEKPGEELKFNKWKLKECIGKIIRSGLQTHEAKELYYSLPTIKSEDVINFCKQVCVEKKSNLMKLIDREDKLSSYLLGQVRSHFKDQVEMSEAQSVVSANISKWKEEFLKVEEVKPEPKEEKIESIPEGEVKEKKEIKEESKSDEKPIQVKEEVKKPRKWGFKKKEKTEDRKVETREDIPQKDLVEEKEEVQSEKTRDEVEAPKEEKVDKSKQDSKTKKYKPKEVILSEDWQSFTAIPEESSTPLGRKPKKRHWKAKRKSEAEVINLSQSKKGKETKDKSKKLETKKTEKKLKEKRRVKKVKKLQGGGAEVTEKPSKKPRKRKVELSVDPEAWKSYESIPTERSTPLGRKPKKKWKVQKSKSVEAQELPRQKKSTTKKKETKTKPQVEKKIKQETTKIEKKTLQPKKVNKKREEQLHYKATKEWKKFEAIPVESATPLGRKPKKKIWKTKAGQKLETQKPSPKKQETEVKLEKTEEKKPKSQKVKKESTKATEKTAKSKNVNKTREEQLMSKASEEWKTYKAIPEERSTPLGRKPKKRKLKRKKL